MSAMKLTFNISDQSIKEHLIRTGERMAACQEITVDLAQLTPDERRDLIAVTGMTSCTYLHFPATTNTWVLADLTLLPDPLAVVRAFLAEARVAIEQKAIEDAEKREADTTKLIARYAELQRLAALPLGERHDLWAKQNDVFRLGLRGDLIQDTPLYKQAVELRDRLEREASAEGSRRHEEQDRARRAADQEAKERAAESKNEWIDAHGSEYLKQAFARGYGCQRKYVSERAAAEFPGWGFGVDFDDLAEWKARSAPSEAALEAELELEKIVEPMRAEWPALEVQTVWLTAPPRRTVGEDGEPLEEFEACEALVVRNYLGRYDLVKEM